MAVYKNLTSQDPLDSSNPVLIMDLLKIMAGASDLRLLSKDLLKVSGFLTQLGEPYVQVAALGYQTVGLYC